MPKLSCTTRRLWQRGIVIAVSTAALALAGAAPALAVEHVAATAHSMTRQANTPFLFNYTFDGHLKIAGGYFTPGGRVQLVVKFNNGAVKFTKNVTAQTHPITPGGAIYVDTPIAAPCAPGNNGYAQAYDYTTNRWSPRLPVAICVRID